MLKKIFLFILIMIFVMTIASCGKKANETVSDYSSSGYSTGTVIEKSSTGITEEQTNNGFQDIATDAVNSTALEGSLIESAQDVELLHSANVDLNNDGIKEEVEALQLKTKGKSAEDPGELEGILKITSGEKVSKVSFIKKQAGMTGVMSSFEFRDLDGDGSKDVFIIVPDSSAAFSLNYYFAYNYKKDKSYSFTSDSNLITFINGFSFKYKGEGRLQLANNNLGFSALFDISNDPGFNSDDKNNFAYESSWIEPTPVEIAEDSRIALKNSEEGAIEIKVPLPIFGLATVDMIGEMDIFYRMNKEFVPEMSHFDLFQIEKNGKKDIGNFKLKNQ